MGGGVCPKSVCLDGGWRAVRWLSGSSRGAEHGSRVGSCVSVSGIPICTFVFQRWCRPSMKSSRIFEVSVLSTALATLLTAQEARVGLTLFLLGRLDPESLSPQKRPNYHLWILFPSSCSPTVVFTFLMLWPAHGVPCVMLTLYHKAMSLLLQCCNFATVFYHCVLTDV